jgi:hypothetical protein
MSKDGSDEDIDDWFDAGKISEQIEAQSKELRADPVACLAEFLKDFWTDNTDEEARLVWRHRVRTAPWYTKDMLYCLDAVIANPPPQLEKFVREQGGLYLYHPDGTATLYSDAETLEWLKKVAQEFRAIYEEAQVANEVEE